MIFGSLKCVSFVSDLTTVQKVTTLLAYANATDSILGCIQKVVTLLLLITRPSCTTDLVDMVSESV